jgi:glutaredoxin
MVEAEGLKEAILVVAEGCPYCEEMKKRLPKDKVKVLDVTKDVRAAAILRDLGVYKVPVLVTVERTEKGTELCSLDDKSLQVKCVQASEEATKEST